ncbi:MAG: FecR family protein, partial [Candidatus Omnitrophota bacterium]|nr:FecR family protein [Candidatus Omnitrophota bacterium]
MKKTAFFILVCMLTCMIYSVPAVAAEAGIGKYTFISGRADVLHKAGGGACRIKENDPVYLGDIVRTKSNSRVEITFDDESVLRLAPNSRVAVEEYSIDENSRRQNALVKLFRGKMRAIVSRNGSSSNFHILTPSAKGIVKGTDVYAFHQADMTGILVKEGKMTVCNPSFSDKKTSVTKGDFISIPVDGAPGKCREYLDAELSMHEKDTEPLFLPQVKVHAKGMLNLRGMITGMGGDVSVLKSAKKEWRRAIMGEVLIEGDKVRTGDDGKVRISLENGNMLSLQPNSEILLKIMRLDPKTGEYDNSFESDYGKIKAIVEKIGAKSSFKVKTPTAVCAVRGTVMYLDVGPGQTTAFYEGGGGEVTNLLSGESETVGAGQNSTADNMGNVSVPGNTTGEERMNLDETWESGGSVDDYSTPDGDTSQGGAGGSTSGDGPTIDDLLEELDNENSDSNLFNDVLPPYQENADNTVTPDETAAFTGNFGEVAENSHEEIEFIQDKDTSVSGDFAFSVPGSGDRWGGRSTSGNSVNGIFSGRGDYRLWGCDTDYTASDGGRMMGKTGGTMIGDDLTGKVFGIYVDTQGYGGTYSSFYRGDVGDHVFNSAGDMEMDFTSRDYVGITPGELDLSINDDNDLCNGKGLGSFTGTREILGEKRLYTRVSGISAKGTITCTDLGGGSMSMCLEDQNEREWWVDWGIWWIEAKGIYTAPDSDNWKLALGGQSTNSEEGSDYENGTDAWVGTVNGTEWNSGGLVGSFSGHFFHENKDGDGDRGGSVCGGNIFNGDIVGGYEVGVYEEDFTWEALGGGEWVEITDLLSEGEGYLGFTISEFENFVTVPITEAYSSLVTGVTDSMSLTMDVHLYE